MYQTLPRQDGSLEGLMKLDIPALVRKPTAENRNATQVRAFAARPNPGGRATSDTGLVLGVAVSMIAFLLIVMPAVAIVALVAWSFQPRRSTPAPGSQLDETLPGRISVAQVGA
jgi:hypothetical protein